MRSTLLLLLVGLIPASVVGQALRFGGTFVQEESRGDGAVVWGRVTDELGEPLIGASVVTSDREGVVTDLGGTFRLELDVNEARRTTLTVRFVGFTPFSQELLLKPGTRIEAEVALSVGGAVICPEDLAPPLRVQSRIEGVIPVLNGIVRVRVLRDPDADPRRERIRLWSSGFSTTLETNEHGIVLAEVPPGAYRLELLTRTEWPCPAPAHRSPQPLPIREGRAYDWVAMPDLAGRAQEPAPRPPGGVRVQSSEGANAVIRGRVVDERGSPLPGASLYTDSVGVIADIAGEFRLEVPVISSRHVTFRASFPGYFSWVRPLVLQRGDRVAADVTLEADSTTICCYDVLPQVRVDMEASCAVEADGGAVRIRVRSPDGRALTNRIRLDKPGFEVTLSPDRDGMAWAEIPPGSYRLSVLPDGGFPCPGPTLRAPRRLEVVAGLEATWRITVGSVVEMPRDEVLPAPDDLRRH